MPTYTIEWQTGNMTTWEGSDPETFDHFDDVLRYCAEDTALEDGYLATRDTFYMLPVGVSMVIRGWYGGERERIAYRVKRVA